MANLARTVNEHPGFRVAHTNRGSKIPSKTSCSRRMIGQGVITAIYKHAWRRILRSALIHFWKDRTYIVKYGISKGFLRRGGTEFIPRPLSKEEKLVVDLDLAGQTVYDIGANEGVFSMFFSKAVAPMGKVIAFEPHPANCSKLLEHMRLNNISNVTLVTTGVGKENGNATLIYREDDLAVSTVVEGRGRRILDEKAGKAIEIEVDTLDRLSRTLPKPDFIKIDVEGAELEVLLGMEEIIRTHRPRLLIEIHGMGGGKQSKIDNGKKVIHFLAARGYSIYHVETSEWIARFLPSKAKQDHFYCISKQKEKLDNKV